MSGVCINERFISDSVLAEAERRQRRGVGGGRGQRLQSIENQLNSFAKEMFVACDFRLCLIGSIDAR